MVVNHHLAARIEPRSIGIWKSTCSLLAAELSLQIPPPTFFETGFHVSWAPSMNRDDPEFIILAFYFQSSGITGVRHSTCLGKQIRILMHAGQAFYQLGYLSSSLKSFFKVSFKHCWALSMFFVGA